MDRKSERTQSLNEIILSSIDEWVRVVDQDYNVVFSNQSMRDACGDMTGTPCFHFWEGEKPCTECVSEQARLEGVVRRREVVLGQRYYKVQCYPLVLQDGTCSETVEIITDITDRKQLEFQRQEYTAQLEEEVDRKTAQIRKNQEIILRERKNFEKILEHMQDLVYVIGRDYSIQYMNPVFVRKYGNRLNEKCFRVIHGLETHCRRCLTDEVFDKKQILRWTSFLEDEQRFYDVIEAPMEEPDGTVSMLVTMRDITEMKHTEEKIKKYSISLEEKVQQLVEEVRVKDRLALLGEISAGLAHELRNPLGSLVAGIRLLEREGKSEDERKTVYDILKKESERLNKSLSDFLDYARPRRLQLSDVDLNRVLGEILGLIRQDSQLMGGNTIVEKYASRLPRVSAESDRVKQVFWNILVNGMRSMDGRGRLAVETSVDEGWARVDFTDTGKGIAPENIEKIFAPFFSLRRGGTGLGLAIVRRIMEEHGGKIEVESREGQGTRFRALFPLERQSSGVVGDRVME